MKFATSLALASGAFISAVSAQVSYDNATDTWSCPIANGAYCAGDSLSTPVVILCTNGVGTPGNCIPHNWNRPPSNVYYSPCYQSSSTAGDAACAKDCTVYPDTGLPFAVPGSCNATYYNSIDVTGGVMASNGTMSNGTMTNSTMSSNSTMRPSTTSTSAHATTSTSAASSSPSAATGAAGILGAAPVAGYVILALAALAL